MTAVHDPSERRLAWRTSPEVESIAHGDALVIQPIASVEQHGPHLPCYTDSLVAEGLVARALAVTPVEVNVWTLPVIAYGKSNEHLGFPGTISLSAETLLAVCRDVGRSVARSGFRKLAFVNGHGGQPHLLDMVARDIREETGLMVFPLFPYRLGVPEGVVSSPEEAEFGIHGGELETSLVLALEPDAVHMDRLESGGDRVRKLYGDLQYLSLEGALPTAWLTRDLSENGVIGDPTNASAERGERAVAHLAEALSKVFAEICEFEL
jgi:creatinine amidohydrolase/Fe(II)-dependent formamide hydrolase-like protein